MLNQEVQEVGKLCKSTFLISQSKGGLEMTQSKKEKKFVVIEETEEARLKREKNNEEDIRLVELARLYDDYAIEELFIKYSPIIKFNASKYFAPGLEREDLIQEGRIGLMNAIRDFNVDKKASFKVFSGICIERNIITAVKAANRKKKQPLNKYKSFDAPVNSDSNRSRESYHGGSSAEGKSFYEGLQDNKQFSPEEIVIEKESVYEILARLKDVLSPFEEKVFEYRLMRYTYQEIADKLGRSPKAVDNALQRIREKYLK